MLLITMDEKNLAPVCLSYDYSEIYWTYSINQQKLHPPVIHTPALHPPSDTPTQSPQLHEHVCVSERHVC